MDRKKILIIDDDLDQRRGLSVRLRANNYETVFGMSDETTRGTRILLIEDEPAFVRLIQVFLGHTAGSQFEIFHVDRLSKGLERLAAGGIDLVLLDLSLPDSWGYETLAKIQPHIHQVPIVVLTGLDDETLAVRAVQEGAQDYLPKASVNAALLVRSVQYAMERHRIKEELHTLSTKDELTGLHNRRGFFTLAQQQLLLANRNKAGCLLLFADLDGLKRINDTLGHHEGDRALIEIARVLNATFRESDIVARMAGDEFAVLAIDAREDDAQALTTRLDQNLAGRNATTERVYALSLSVGVAGYDPTDPCSLDDLLNQADARMYKQKRGKPKVGPIRTSLRPVTPSV